MSKSKKKKIKTKPLTRWAYFLKTLYNDGASTTEFTYEKVVYVKSEELQDLEQDNKRINAVLLLDLFAMFMITSKYQNIWVFIGYMVVVIIGQIVRLVHLPRNILDHLEDTGRRKR